MFRFISRLRSRVYVRRMVSTVPMVVLCGFLGLHGFLISQTPRKTDRVLESVPAGQSVWHNPMPLRSSSALGEVVYSIPLQTLSSSRIAGVTPTSADGFVLQQKMIPVRRLAKGEYEENVLMIKTKQIYMVAKGASTLGSSALQATLASMNTKAVRHIAPEMAQGKKFGLLSKADEFGVSRWYEVRFDAPIDPFDLCKELMENPDVEVAEPVYTRKPTQDRVIPTDPRYGEQYAHRLIQSERAWAVTRGNANLLIAIVDNGTDVNHEDLREKIWTNPGESGTDSQGRDRRTNGIDDDNNGKVDDWRGWDFIGNITNDERLQFLWKENNLPVAVTPPLVDPNDGRNHGTHVAGLAGATPNNGRGIVGSGFNCMLLPIKVASDVPALPGYYRTIEGILYAGQMGAHVINCSFGGTGGSAFDQDIINQVTLSGSLVVAAAGNSATPQDNLFFPADYDNVLSVGSSTSQDRPSSFSNYGINTTVFAPGSAMLSTVGGNQYAVYDGTSMAAPLLSGIAALVRGVNPSWTPYQVIQQLRSTSDNVLYPGQSQRPYEYFGRLNAFRAVSANRPLNTGDQVPGISHLGIGFAVNNTTSVGALNTFQPVTMRVFLRNFLSNAQNVTASLSTILTDSLSPYRISIGSGPVQISAINTGQDAFADFTIKLEPTVFNTVTAQSFVQALLTIRSGDYVNYERVTIQYDIRPLVTTNTVPDFLMQSVLNFPVKAGTAAPRGGEQQTGYVFVRNIGPSAISFSTATISGPNASEFSLAGPLSSRGINPAGGANATNIVGVNYTPRSAGTKTATLTLTGVATLTSGGGGGAGAAGYSFGTASGAYSAITGGTRLGGGAAVDDNEWQFTLEHPFTFAGQTVRILRISSNGFFAFDGTQPLVDPAGTNTVVAAIASPVAATGIVSAFSEDLQCRAEGEIRVQTLGTAPNRTTVIQFSNMSFYGQAGPLPLADMSFQIRLNEGSNSIQIVYGSMTNGYVASQNPVQLVAGQVGLRGTVNTDFHARSVVFNETSTWAASARGTANTANCALLNASALNPPTTAYQPASGLTYTFTPGSGGGGSTSQVLVTRTTQLNAVAPVQGGGLTFGVDPFERSGSNFATGQYFIGSTTNGLSIARIAVIRNTGFAPVTNLRAEYFGVDTSAFRITSPLPAVLNAGDSTLVNIQFAPRRVGGHEAGVMISGGNSPSVVINLAGTSIVSGSILRFTSNGANLGQGLSYFALGTGALRVGDGITTSTTATGFGVRNIGTAPMTITGADFVGVGANEFSIISPAFPFTLPPDGSQIFVLRLLSTGIGEKLVTLTMRGQIDENQSSLGFVNNGVAPRFIVVTRRTANTVLNTEAIPGFSVLLPNSPVGIATFGTIAIQNAGTAAVTITSGTFTGAGASDFTLQGVTFPLVVPAGITQTLSVRFLPSAEGRRIAQFTVRHSFNAIPDIITVEATGINTRQIVLPGNFSRPWNFGQRAVFSRATVTGIPVRNSGSDTVRISRLRISSPTPNEFIVSSNANVLVIPPGQTVTYGVTFAPVTVGQKRASLVIESNGTPSSFELFSFIGEGIAGGVVSVDTITGRPGDNLNMVLRVVQVNPSNLPIGPITGLVRFNSSLLEPADAVQLGVVRNGVRNMRFTTPATAGANGVLLSIPMKVLLGNDSTTAIEFDSLAYTAAGTFLPVNFTSGIFRLTGINRAGGVRLINSQRLALAISSVSPNPSLGLMTAMISTEVSTDVAMTIHNASGTLVQTLPRQSLVKGTNRVELDLRGLASGTYFVSMTGDGEMVTAPIVIVR